MSARRSLRSALRAADKRLSAALPLEQRRRWFYLKAQRRLPHFREPVTFSEKVNWRMLNDRREQLTWTCDKLKMKERARASGADVVVVPQTLWHGRDVRELAAVRLPECWVLKPTHRYGLVHFGGPETDLEMLAEQTSSWLTDVQSEFLGEWAYAQAEAQFLVEEFIGRPGAPPDDYKIFVFHGEPRLVQVDLDRFSGHRRSLFTPDWEKIDATYLAPDAGPLPRPPLLEQMLHAARVLAKDFDFIRIDLYLDGDKIVFGEYTPYPGGGLIPFRPWRLDVELGALWKLPSGAAADA